MKITPRKKRLHAAGRVSPSLAWGDFHAHSRFARSTIPEEKWGSTRSLYLYLPYVESRGRLELNWAPRSEKKLLQKVRIGIRIKKQKVFGFKSADHIERKSSVL